MADDKLRAILSEAKSKGASEEQLVKLIQAYQGSKKKDSSESQSTGEQKPTSGDSAIQEGSQPTQKSPFAAPKLNPQLAADMAAAAKLERAKRGELDKAPRTEYERYQEPEAPKKIQNENGEMVDPRYVEVQRKKAQQAKEQEARDLGYFDGIDKEIDPSAPVNEQNAAARQEVLQNLDRAKRGAKQLQDTKLGEQLGIDTEAPSKLETYNGKLRKAQQIITQLDDMVENGINLSGQYHAYSKTEQLTEDQVNKFTQQAINDVSEILGLDPADVSLDDLRNHVNRNREFTEGILFEQTVDRAAWKEATQSGKDLTLFRTATYDAVLNLGNQAAVAAYDLIGNPIEAERYQQAIAERSVRASLELGYDPYDSKSATEEFQDGNIGIGIEKTALMAAQSWLPMATAMIAPEAAVLYGGVSSGLGTYEAYRDRGDLTEEEKFLLSFGTATTEAAITAIGMGNIRRARAAAGITDVAGEMSTAARRTAYKKALDFLEPSMTRVKNVLKNPTVRGAGTFIRDVGEEQLEELSIAAVSQGLAYAIANDKFDAYEFGDTFLSTLMISSPTSGLTGVKTFKNYSHINAMPDVDKMNDFEALGTQYSELKEAIKSPELTEDQRSIIKDEMRVVKSEINKMKIEAMDRFDNMSEDDQAKLIAVNSQIRKLSKEAKKTEDPTVKRVISSRLAAALDFKRNIESGKAKEATFEEGRTAEAPQTPQEGTDITQATQASQDAKAEAEARRQAAADRMQPKETPRDMVNRRVRYTNPVNGEVVEGVLAQDGQRLVVETDKGQIFDVGNFDELADQNVNEVKSVDNTKERTRLENQLEAKEQRKEQLPAKIKELRGRVKNTNSKAGKDKLRTQIQELKAEQGTIDQDIEDLKSNIDAIANEPATEQKVLPIELAETTTVSANPDGTFTYNSTKGAAPKGTKMKPSNGVKSIRRDKNGNITRVVMNSIDGAETFNLKGQDAEDMAYQLHMQEMSTPEGEAKVNAELEADAEAQRILEQEEAKQVENETKAAEPKAEPSTKTKEAPKRVSTKSAEPAKQRNGRISTKGDVKLSDKAQTAVERVVSALGVVVPDVNIVMHSARDTYNGTHANASKDIGHYNPNTNTIHLLVDGDNPLNLEGWLLLKHEAIHPVLDAILANDPAFANMVEGRIKDIMRRYAKDTEQEQRVLAHYDRYAGRSDQSLELLTEFLSVFSEPEGMRMISRDKTALEKVADLFQAIADRILGYRGKAVPASKKEIIQLLNNINEAFSSGRQIEIVQTKAEVRQAQIRQSLRRDNDLKNAILPKRGATPEEVLNQWEASNNNFIVAEDFEHSLELRRMGFVESYERPDGKIVLSVPVKYESYDAATNVAKIKSDSFIKDSDVAKEEKKVHSTLKALGKFAGYEVQFVSRPDLNFTSTLLIPDAENGINENTVVVNLAYANERTGAGGFSFAILETLRRKNPAAVNELYYNLKNGKGGSQLFSIFNQYLNTYKGLLPKDSMSKEDLEFVALARVIQESIDLAMTNAANDQTFDFLTEFQDAFSNAITQDVEAKGDYKVAKIPFGENMMPALEALFVNKSIELKEDVDELEQKMIERLSSNVEKTAFGDVSIVKSFINKFNNAKQNLKDGQMIMTTFEAIKFAGVNDSLIKKLIDNGSISYIVGTDAQIKEYVKILHALNNVFESANGWNEIKEAYRTQDSSKLSADQKIALDAVEKSLDIHGNASYFVNSDRELTSEFESHMYSMSNDEAASDIMDIVKDGWSVSRQSFSDFRAMDKIKINVSDADILKNSDSIIEFVENNILDKAKKAEEAKELVKKAKTFEEAFNMAVNMSGADFTDGVFETVISGDEVTKLFPSRMPAGAESLLNNSTEVTISAIPDSEGFLSITYDIYSNQIGGGYHNHPANWKIWTITMPLVFEYANKIGAITNASGIKFFPVDASPHPELKKKGAFTKAELDDMAKGKGDTLRRGLNNLFALRHGHLVSAKTSKEVAFTLPDEDNNVYVTKNKEALAELEQFQSYIMGQGDGVALKIGMSIGKKLVNIVKAEAADANNKDSYIIEAKDIAARDAEADKINSQSYSLEHANRIDNNYPMRSAFKNDEKYISSAGIRQMLTPTNENTGRKAAGAIDQMFQNAEEIAMQSGKKKFSFKTLFSREALIDRSAKLKKAMENGLSDFIKAQFTNLNGTRANADRLFHKVEKNIFGGLSTTEEVMLDKIVLLRRIIQIDTNWDNSLQEYKVRLSAEKGRLESLRADYKQAKTESDKKDIKAKVKESKNKVKYYEGQVDKYSVRPKHPTDGTMPMNLENAIAALEHYKKQLGAEQYNKLYERSDRYFNEYKKILTEARDSGLIDQETYDRFIGDNYSPRVFLNRMFGDTDMNVFDAMNLSQEQIQGIQEGSDLEIFTDIRFLLNTSMRAIKNKQSRNALYSLMDKTAKSKGYDSVNGFMKEANYKKNKDGSIKEDGFGNYIVEKAAEGYRNVFYRENGRLRAFQIKAEHYGELTGTDDRRLFGRETKKVLRKVSGVVPLKMFATGIKPVFAIVATIRGFQEVTRGRGVYDSYKLLPAMQVMAMLDFFKGLGSAVMNDADVEDYFAHGGGMTFMTTEGRPDKIYKRKNSTTRRLLGKLSPVKGTIHVLAYAGEKAELGLRIGIYKRALETIKKARPELTLEQQKALAVEEARLLADFSQGGYITKDLDVLKPYINAAVQGTRGTFEYARKNPKMFVVKQIQAYAIQAAMAYLASMMMDEEEEEKIPPYIRNRYNLIPTFIKNENGKMIFLRSPKVHQFMGLDHAAMITGKAFAATSKGEEWSWSMYEKNDISGVYLSEDGRALADAILSSLPAGDLLPEEIFTPAKLTLDDFTWQILSNIPTFGATDAYTHNIDRYRQSAITYNFEQVHPLNEAYKDGKTRDIYKFLTGIYNSQVAEANTMSAPRLQAAVEKLVTNESNSVISLVYNLTDALIRTADESEGIQLSDKHKKKIEMDLGLKRAFIYTIPDKKYDINQKKLLEDIDRHEGGNMNKIKKDLRIYFKNAEYELGGKLPKEAIEYIKGLPVEYKKYAAQYYENMAKGYEIEPIFIDVKYSKNAVAAAAKLKLAFGFNSWDELPKDVKKEIGEGLERAGYNWKQKEFLHELK